MVRPALRGSALVVCSAVGFGLMPVFATYAYARGVNVPTLLLARFTLAAVVLFGYLAARRRLPRLTARQAGSLLLLGGVLYALQSTLYFTAVRHVSPAVTVLLFYLYPAFVLVLSVLRDRHRPSLAGMGAVGLSLGGLVLVVGRPDGRLSLPGVAYAVGAALVYAVYIMVGDRVTSRVPPLPSSAFVALSAAVSFAATGAATGSLHLDLPAGAWPPVVGVALVSTVVAIGCFFAGMALTGPVRASVISTVEPVVAIVATGVLLGATMTGGQLLGGAVVLAGAVWGTTVPGRGAGAGRVAGTRPGGGDLVTTPVSRPAG
jgi:drug/metabolite transporter (DMT)-like permease